MSPYTVRGGARQYLELWTSDYPQAPMTPV